MAFFAVSANRGSSVRSPGGLLTAWLGAWLQGRVSADDVLAPVETPHLPQTVDGLPGEGDGALLVRLLAAVRACGPSTVELRLPVAGDADGLGPDALPPAPDAGEAAVAAPRRGPRRGGGGGAPARVDGAWPRLDPAAAGPGQRARAARRRAVARARAS